MITAPLALVVAALASLSDLASATPAPTTGELELVPVNVGGYLGARFTNRGARPIDVVVSTSCAGTTPITARLSLPSGPATPLTTTRPRPSVDKDASWLVRTLGPGDATTVVSNNVRIVTRARPAYTLTYSVKQVTVRSEHLAPVADEPPLRVTVRIDGAEALVEHVIARGAPRRRYFVGWVGACRSWKTQLVADGVPVDDWPEAPRVCDGPVLPDIRKLAGGDSFVVRGPLPARLRGRPVRARFTGETFAGISTMGAPFFVGTVESEAVTP